MTTIDIANRVRKQEVESLNTLLFGIGILSVICFAGGWLIWEMAHHFWGQCYLGFAAVSLASFLYLCRNAE